MAELDISKRVSFPKGQLRVFITKIEKLLKINSKGLGEILSLSDRTIRDWKREKFLMSLNALRILSGKINRPLPTNIKIKDSYWYTSRGSSKGGLAVIKKYGHVCGDPEYRKKKWYEWWNKVGRHKRHSITIPKSIKKPNFSEDLAEFVGIVMGDGGLTKSQLVITLNYLDDLEYSNFVVKLIKKLFNVMPSKRKRPNSKIFNICVSRVVLVRFCTEIGLKIGNKIKQQIDIPEWIKTDVKFKIACLRGLIDTDGCLIIHKYKSRDKHYTYKKIAFTSRSLPLLKSVSAILDELNFKHRVGNNFDIRIEAQENVKNYFKIVRTHNPKHLKRYYL